MTSVQTMSWLISRLWHGQYPERKRVSILSSVLASILSVASLYTDSESLASLYSVREMACILSLAWSISRVWLGLYPDFGMANWKNEHAFIQRSAKLVINVRLAVE